MAASIKLSRGTENTFDHDMPVAVHDCRTSCGARLIAESANKPWNPAWADGLSSPRFEAPPNAPPPLNDSEMRSFHTQAEKQGLGDRKTLAQYRKVTVGISLSAGHYSGWENRDIPINGEALVYVKNIGEYITPVTVKAGISRGEIQIQGCHLVQQWEHVFRFIGNPGTWVVSVDAPTDVYMLHIEVWTKDIYAN